MKKAKEPVKSKKKQYLFRPDRVEEKEKEGWKIVNKHVDRKQIGVEDLILMEK